MTNWWILSLMTHASPLPRLILRLRDCPCTGVQDTKECHVASAEAGTSKPKVSGGPDGAGIEGGGAMCLCPPADLIEPPLSSPPQLCHMDVLFPKAINIGELYGEYNQLTSEWTDGLASTLVRHAVADSSSDWR